LIFADAVSERALGASCGIEGQHCRALEECGRGCQAASGTRAPRRPLQLLGDLLVGSGCGIGPVPRASIGISLQIGGVAQGRMHFSSFLR
jgi:hypothetical protein